jgi:CRISPR/Cas system-associated exonuclease Cas4 (RecB family)
VTTTTELLLRADQKRARHHQDEFGVSEIGGCRRRAGYRLHQVPPSNAGGSVVAALGAAIHEAVAKQVADIAEPGDLVEHEVRFAGVLGHLDRYEAATYTVIDTKTTSSRWLEHIKLHGPDEPHRWQVNIYGAALVREGRRVDRVRVEYIARDTGEEWTWEGRFEPDVVRDALRWLRNVQQVPLEMLPRDYMPDSVFCHSCRFADICWPYGLEGRGAAKVLLTQVGGADEAARELWEARQAKKAAEQREKIARAALEDVRPLEGMGLVDTADHRLAFRANGLFFVSRDSNGRQPAVGYEEGDG